jgi:hypothetical protein
MKPTCPHTPGIYKSDCAECSRIYQREWKQRKYGYTPRFPDAASRFLASVIKGETEDACWGWKPKARGTGGYARIRIAGKLILAHRFSYELHAGQIPEDMCVLHNCPNGDNPECTNPRHLWLGTIADNNTDRAKKGRSATGDRHPTHTNPWLYQGENNGRAILSAADVVIIKELLAEGTRSGSAIAKQFGVTKYTISDIKRGKTWHSLEAP